MVFIFVLLAIQNLSTAFSIYFVNSVGQKTNIYLKKKVECVPIDTDDVSACIQLYKGT